MQRLDAVRVQVEKSPMVTITWNEAIAIRRELRALGFESLPRDFETAGRRGRYSSPVPYSRLLEAVERVESSARLDVLAAILRG